MLSKSERGHLNGNGSGQEQPQAVCKSATQHAQEELEVTAQEPSEAVQAAAEVKEPPEAGEPIAIIKPGSTVTSPKLWIGRCVKIEGEVVVVTPFTEIAQDTYVFKVGGGRQKVPLSQTVYPIDFVHRPGENDYQLRTKKTEIHLCLTPLL